MELAAPGEDVMNMSTDAGTSDAIESADKHHPTTRSTSDVHLDGHMLDGQSDGASSSGIAKFKCPHCPKVCLKSETLTRHIETHRDKEYTCNACKFVSFDFIEIRDHRRLHMSKHCNFCKFSTNRADALKKHLSMHTGSGRPGDDINGCSQCDFAPKNPVALKHHLKHHHDLDMSRDGS